MPLPCGCSWDGCGNVAGRVDFNRVRTRTHCLHTITKLELASKRQGSRPPAPDEEPSPTTSCSLAAAETRDFQESIAENETAAMRLQGAEERGQPRRRGTPAAPVQPGLGHREPGVCSPRVCIYADTHILHSHYLYTFVSMKYFTINTTLKPDGDFPGSSAVKTSPPIQEVWVQSLVREQRSHMPPGQKKNQKQYCNKFSEDF